VNRDPLIALGKAVRTLRKAIDISQEELGFRSGLHRNYVSGVERGERNVTYLSLLKICEGLGTDLHSLLNEIDSIGS